MYKYGLFFLLFLQASFGFTFQYPQIKPNYYSQHGQDKYLAEKIFKDKQEGFFLEIGAHDGISFSNTCFFEKHLNWKGICVEPIPELFENLKINRACIVENFCIDTTEGKKKFLRCFGYITEMYSGIEDYYDSRHLSRINEEILEYEGSKTIIEVDCITINQLLEKHSVKAVDLLSLDIEGGEEKILRSINFNEIKIGVILVENNFDEDSIRSFLSSKNYIFINRIGKDDLFVREDFFPSFS